MEVKGTGHNFGLGVRKGAWSANEDLLLTRHIHKHGEGKWHLIPKTAGLNRCRKSCRLRWLNYLSPSIKRGKFGDDEIDLMIRLHKLLGNRWSLIAGRIPGRTANDIKNFWNIHLKKTQISNIFNNKTKSLSKIDIPNKVEVIRPRARSFSKNLFFLKNKSVIIETQDNKFHDTLNKTKEITCQTQSKTILSEENGHGNGSSLLHLKSPCNKVDAIIPSKDMFLEEGSDYWKQELFTSHCLIQETELETDGVSLEGQIQETSLETDWADLLWENLDIWS